MKRVLVVSAAVLALAACNKSAGRSGGAQGGGQAAAPTAEGMLASPTRKAGLWQVDAQRDGKPAGGRLFPGPIKTCIDAQSDTKGAIFGRAMTRGLCSQANSTKNLDGSYSFSSTCQFGGGATITTKGTITGDWNARYVVHAETDVSGSERPERNGHHTSDTTATCLGPCPAGMTG